MPLARPGWAPGPQAWVNWNHPLAYGLEFFVIPSLSLDVSRQFAPSASGTTGVGESVYGPASTFTGNGKELSSAPILGPLADSTITAVGFIASSGSQGAAYGERNATPIYRLTVSPSSSYGAFTFRDSENNLRVAYKTGGFVGDVVMSGTRTAATTFRLWLNGNLANELTQPTNVTFNAPPAIIGYEQATGVWPGRLTAVIGHSRSLSPSEIAMLHTDPFCMLEDAA